MHDANERLPGEAPHLLLPRCPECDAPRTLVCPVCGNDEGPFEPADGNFLETIVELALPGCDTNDSAVAEAGEENGSACGVSPPDPDVAPTEHESMSAAGGRAVVICPRCDEAAPAEFAIDCHGCGHAFDDGRPNSRRPPGHDSPPNGRVVATIWALAALFAAAIGYFWWVFR